MYGGTIPVIKLANKVKIPTLGYGVAALDKGNNLNGAVHYAVVEGYRFFDTAPLYGNEAEVGTALRSSGLSRGDLFISSKLPNNCHAFDEALKAFDRSLKALGTDYLDMYLIHAPMPLRGLYCEAWRALEKLYKEGRVNVIGLSNFNIVHLQKIFETAEIRPMTNELECNPYRSIVPLRTFCSDNGIRVINWFPLGGPQKPLIPYPTNDYKVLMEDKLLFEIGKKYGKTTAQIALRWAIDSNMIPIPKSAHPSRIRQNRDIFDFSLTADEIKQIDALNHDRRLGPDFDTYNELQNI